MDENPADPATFTFDDFRRFMLQTKKLGPLNKIVSLVPGMGRFSKYDAEADMRWLLGIIDSMTPEERRNISRTIEKGRRGRIAAGSGVEPAEVDSLVKQCEGMSAIMKSMGGNRRT